MIHRSFFFGFGRTIVAIGLFFALPFLLSGHGEVFAAVVINEVLPKTEPVTSQYIELYNNGSESVSLDRWTLENTNGEKKTFTINASAIVPGNGFYTFYQPQTGITFSITGDTVILKDASGTIVDSQSYPSTLGYYISVGRTVDGGGVWAICTSPATNNKTNNCPPPPPTSTPIPTAVPTSTPIPTATPTLTVIAATLTPVPVLRPVTFGQITNSEVLGTVNSVVATLTPTPAPTPGDELHFAVPKSVLWQAGVVIAAWIILIGAAYLRKQYKRRSVKK
jgi:hypothetical protein